MKKQFLLSIALLASCASFTLCSSEKGVPPVGLTAVFDTIFTGWSINTVLHTGLSTKNPRIAAVSATLSSLLTVLKLRQTSHGLTTPYQYAECTTFNFSVTALPGAVTGTIAAGFLPFKSYIGMPMPSPLAAAANAVALTYLMVSTHIWFPILTKNQKGNQR